MTTDPLPTSKTTHPFARPADDVFDLTQLIRLRSSVEEWSKHARDAVRDFQRDDGSFHKDSKAAEEVKMGKEKSVNVTTTARSYVAMLYAHRADPNLPSDDPSWSSSFCRFMSEGHPGFGTFFDPPSSVADDAPGGQLPGEALQDGDEDASASESSDVNIFDIAHIADFHLVRDYLERFSKLAASESAETGKAYASSKQKLVECLQTALKQASDQEGQIRFESENEDSAHFFATLHVLRALYILNAPIEASVLRRIVDHARLFAVEQCYYFQRGTTHRQDPVRLAFAGCIYAVYEDHIDKDLCLAVVEALAQSQQSNGSWPATHPVLRGKRTPWHITSHEVALCLTWLYFQPKVQDDARPLLMGLMQRHFARGVIPTFLTAKPTGLNIMRGWQDDHTVSPNVVVGWATAIVGHFIANFSFVLSDWINRRIIEDLRLEDAATHYIIDDTVSGRSLRWRAGDTDAFAAGVGAVWPDLPNYAWKRKLPETEALASAIYRNWTDPRPRSDHSRQISEKVLLPMFRDPAERPMRGRCAGLLPGSPGTRKTSFVKLVAKSLSWPMVPVPASLIFEKGFDLMESQASEVFKKLNELRGCVIFFDEFEEFFLDRNPSRKSRQEGNNGAAGVSPRQMVEGVGDEADGPETPGSYQNRTIAAFTTSAMLPRLQDLHDKNRCLIFLATNHDERIDEAIKRPGRFDFTIEIDHPGADRLIEYMDEMPENARQRLGLDRITSERKDAVLDAAATVIKAYAAKSAAEDGGARAGTLRFKDLEDMIAELVEAEDVQDGSLVENAKAALERLTRPQDAKRNPPKLGDLSS